MHAEIVACFSSKRLASGDGGSDTTNTTSEIELGDKVPKGDEIHDSHSSSFDLHPADKNTGNNRQGGSGGEHGNDSDEGATAGGRDGGSEGGDVHSGDDAFGVEEEEEGGGVLLVVRLMLGNLHNASFFAAVGLSGMGAGVIDTFLFIR